VTSRQNSDCGSCVRDWPAGVVRWCCIMLMASLFTGCVQSDDPVAAADPGATGGTPPPPPVTPPTPPPAPPPPSLSDQAIFEATLHPLLTDPNNFCAGCHAATIAPTFAAVDPTTAYNAITGQQKVDLMNPTLSRVYQRPKDQRHNCGGDISCDRIAADFLAAIQAWSNQAISNVPPPGGTGQPVLSALTNFASAMDGDANRVDDNAIAMFTFSEGAGDITVDTSGVGDPVTLQIEGMEWVEGGGLRNISGKAQASVADSQKLFNMITPGNAYTVEAWIISENTAQDGPARIVSYSLDTASRNFTLGQNAIYYQLRNKSLATNANGTPALEALDPEVATQLQHVVVTYDLASGRKVYINGQLSIEENVADDALEWSDTHILVLGNETTNDRLWQGVLKLVAIHNTALSGADVQQNFDAGTGNLVTMRFDVSSVIGESAFIDMQAAQIDPDGYLFARPVFVSDASGVNVKNIRIGINGGVPVAAQAFRRVDTIVMASGTELSPLGALIPVQLGPDNDQFHLEFEVLGSQFGMAEMTAPSSPPAVLPDVPEPSLGLRTFSQINDTMSDLTGVDANQGVVLASYNELRGSLPTSPGLLSFGAAHQIAIQRLATSYCGAIVSDAGSCDDFFGACAIDGAGKDQVASTLYDRFVGDNLGVQPDRTGVTNEIVRAIDDLGCAGGCSGVAAETVLQATCAAVLSSAAVTLN